MNTMLVLNLVICLVTIGQGNYDIPGLTMSYDEFLATNGVGYEEYAKCNQIARIVKSRYLKTLPATVGNAIDDTILTLEQWKLLEVLTRNKTTRKIIDFQNNPTKKWDLPIHYFIQPNSYSQTQEYIILASMALWEEQTCIRFAHVPLSGFTGRYIVFAPLKYCRTFIGKYGDRGPQLVGLNPNGCIDMTVVPHEIGHAVGFWHEQSRLDRDEFVDILWDNIDEDFAFNFEKGFNQDTNILNKVPYDFSSFMHYGLKFFAEPESSYAMLPKDPLFIGNVIGDNPRMTFFDAKTANMAYCKDVCSPSTLSCANAGYEDPNNCGSCRCLEGYKGKTCNDIDPGNSGHFSGCPRAGRIKIDPGSGVQCLDVGMSRFFATSDYMECNWYIEASHAQDTIDFWFTSIDLPRNNAKACIDFAEIKYRNLGARGPRFCGTSPPDVLNSPTNFLTSRSLNIMVNMASRLSIFPYFTFCFRTTPRCSIDYNGLVLSTAKSDGHLDKNVKTIVAARGADDDPCKTRIVARSDGQGHLEWSAVNVGIHPKYADKFFKNYAFNLQGKPGAWERGWQLKDDPVLMTFPYPGWNDGSVSVTVTNIPVWSETYHVKAMCLGKLLFEYTFDQIFRFMQIKLGNYDDWTGKCF